MCELRNFRFNSEFNNITNINIRLMTSITIIEQHLHNRSYNTCRHIMPKLLQVKAPQKKE